MTKPADLPTSQTKISNQPDILLRHEHEGICTLTLNRPEKFNALSEEMLAALLKEFDEIDKNEHIRVVVLAANGRAFCAGHDLAQMRASPEQDYYNDLFATCSQFMQRIVSLEKPVIAKIDGLAAAAGCQLVATCDLAVASSESSFAVSGINLGLFCSTPSVALSRNISRKHAFEMLFTGEFIDSEKALEWGLVNQCVASSEIDAAVQALCDKICAKPAVAVATGKRMFYQQIEKNLAQAYQYAGETMACNMMAEDTVEGIDAFLEKRRPSWKFDSAPDGKSS